MEHKMWNLPCEIQWNILKFARHPVADVFMTSGDVLLVLSALRAYNEGPGCVRDDSFVKLWYEIKSYDNDDHDFVKQEIAFLLSDEYLKSGDNEQNVYEELFLSRFVSE